MSVVVAVTDSLGHTALACDSQTTEGMRPSYSAVKAIEAHGCVWGGAGSMAQVQRGHRLVRGLTPGVGREWVETALVTIFEAIAVANNGLKDAQANFVVLTPWGICDMDSAGFVEWAPVSATGTGADAALGAVHALGALPARELVHRAVEAAIAHDIYCGGAINVFTLDASTLGG